jgi:hypothetical protein
VSRASRFLDLIQALPRRRSPARFARAEPVPIRTLLETPGFALSGPAWGARLRFGLLAVDEGSMDLIAGAMGVAGAP